MISGVFERLEDFCLAMSNPQPNLISDDAPIYHHLRWAEAKLMLGRSSAAKLAGAAEKRISYPLKEDAGLQFDAKGNIIVYDARMAHVFTQDGKFIKRIPLKAFTNFTLMTSSGFLFGATQPSFSDKNGPKEGVAKLDPDGTLIGKIAEFRNEFSEGANVMAWHAYNYRLSLSLLDSKSFIYGFSSEYKIYVADAEGKTSLIIVKDEKP